MNKRVAIILLFINTVMLAKWIEPKAKVCVESGGEVKHGTMCYSGLKSAKGICKKIGARLPKIEEFDLVIDACGGDAEHIHLQKTSPEYRSCIERQGLPIRHLYWTSTLYKEGNRTQLMHFTTGVFHTPKSYKDGVVYCVKDE